MSTVDPVVKLDSGFVRGIVEKHEDGFDYYAFKGVPFAEPPIGELRFKDSVPKKKWSGILNCQKFGPDAFQHDFWTGKESYDEDCLHLNVYSHSVNAPNQKTAVFVWIHGGEYSYGTSSDCFAGPDYLIRKKIVLVTVNHRLGVLGFLDLEDEVASGNQGLKDQVMALQWVQRNIRMFGGDPKNVTVGGISAGGASAHYLALSPLSKNLLHKIICIGGIIYNPWVGTNNPRSHAIKLCSLLGKTLTNSGEIVKFFRTVDTKTLLDAQQRLRDTLDVMPFGPGSDSKASTPSLPLHRYAAADQGVHVPSLVGYAAREGLLGLYDPFFFKTISRKEFFTMCDLDFGRLFGYNGQHILDHYNLNSNQVRRLYYKSEVVSEENVDNYIDFMGDIQFIEGVHRFARVQADLSSASTYVYRFDYDSPDSLSKLFLKDAPTGACHYDDIPYLFKMNLIKEKGGRYLEKETRRYKLMQQMTEMWANFVIYGRPTIETSELIPVHWKPISDGTFLRYMNIGEDLTMQSMTNLDQKFASAAQIKA